MNKFCKNDTSRDYHIVASCMDDVHTIAVHVFTLVLYSIEHQCPKNDELPPPWSKAVSSSSRPTRGRSSLEHVEGERERDEETALDHVEGEQVFFEVDSTWHHTKAGSRAWDTNAGNGDTSLKSGKKFGFLNGTW